MTDTPDLFEAPSGPAPVYGCIEAGGTKFVLGVLSAPADTAPTLRIPTTSPQETIQACLAFFAEHAPPQGYAAIGIASFGPLELDRLSPRWGHVTETPKPGWRDTDLAGPFARCIRLPDRLRYRRKRRGAWRRRYGARRSVPTSRPISRSAPGSAAGRRSTGGRCTAASHPGDGPLSCRNGIRATIIPVAALPRRLSGRAGERPDHHRALGRSRCPNCRRTIAAHEIIAYYLGAGRRRAAGDAQPATASCWVAG